MGQKHSGWSQTFAGARANSGDRSKKVSPRRFIEPEGAMFTPEELQEAIRQSDAAPPPLQLVRGLHESD